jgi:hypothetical protein
MADCGSAVEDSKAAHSGNFGKVKPRTVAVSFIFRTRNGSDFMISSSFLLAHILAEVLVNFRAAS